MAASFPWGKPTEQRVGVAVGSAAPEFQLNDPMTGQAVALNSLRGQNVLLVFLRGTWCPYCQHQLDFLKANFEQLSTANIRVVCVACQHPDTVRRYLQKKPLPFPLLADVTRATAKAYGTHYWLTWEGFNLSHPALFILDQAGVITFAHRGRNMRDLPLSLILRKFLSFLEEAAAS